jgi:hypothetical protein
MNSYVRANHANHLCGGLRSRVLLAAHAGIGNHLWRVECGMLAVARACVEVER